MKYTLIALAVALPLTFACKRSDRNSLRDQLLREFQEASAACKESCVALGPGVEFSFDRQTGCRCFTKDETKP